MSYRVDLSHNIEILNLRMEKIEEQMEMLKRIVSYIERTVDQYMQSSSSSDSEVDMLIEPPLSIGQIVKEEVIVPVVTANEPAKKVKKTPIARRVT